jgi:hypothetical protein
MLLTLFASIKSCSSGTLRAWYCRLSVSIHLPSTLTAQHIASMHLGRITYAIAEQIRGAEAAELHATFCKDNADLLRDNTLLENVHSSPEDDSAGHSRNSECWYRSMVLEADEQPSAYAALDAHFPSNLPVMCGLHFHDCLWLFWGHNPLPRSMPGRPEHVDDVKAAGTMHWQVLF